MREVKTIKLPSYLQDMTEKVEESLGLISTGVSVPRISIRGRQFRFVVDGEEISKQTEPINVIILGVEPDKGMAKTFYASGYQPGSTDPPDCSSWNGVTPDTWVDNPQADYCANCEQNVWGSATALSGKKAKACKDSKRLMVVDTKDIKGRIFIFNVTIASLKALSEYGKFLVSNNVPMAVAVTQVAFIDAEFPQVEFNFGGILNKEVGTTMLSRSEEKEWKADIAPALSAGKVAKQLEQNLTDTLSSKTQTVKVASLTPAVDVKVTTVGAGVAAKTVPEAPSDKSIDDLLADWN